MTVTLKDVGSGFKRTAINDNFTTIENTLNNDVLTKDGGTPLEADLDMNSNQLLNVADGVSGTDGVNLNQLNALVAAEGGVSSIVQARESQLGSQAVANIFTLTGITYALGVNTLSVYRNGQRLEKTIDYTETSTSSVTLTFTPNADDRFVFITNDLSTSEVTTTAGITHTQSGVDYNLSAYLQNRDVVNVKDYGAVGDGIIDDTAAIQAAIAVGQGKKIKFPPGTYRIASAPTTSGSDTYYFQITGANTSIEACSATFSLEYDFLTNTTTGSLFNINGATDVCMDSVYATASETTSQISFGYNAVLINNGSKNIEIGQIYSENAVNGLVITDTGANYRASDRYAAPTASSNIHVGNVYVKNDITGGNLSTVGYGVSLSHSGNNTTIDNVRCINTLRACFLYGVHDVRMNVWSTDTAAAGLNLGSFASVENIDIHYREDGQENSGSHAASNIGQINAKEKNTIGGGSNDLGADTPRAHIIRNVKVHFDVNVANRSSLCFLGKEADNPASEDTAEGIIISDIKFSGNCSGVTSGLRLADAAATTPTGWTNTSFRNIVVEDYVSEGINNTLTMRSGFQNSPVIRNVRARGFNCGNEVAGTTNTYPVVYENARLDRLAKAAQDVFIHGINSHFNVEQQTGSNGIVQPYETVLTNTRIGGSAPITKKRYDVYTFVNSSSANYSPSDAMDGVVGGANLNNGADATNLTLNLVSASGSRTSDIAVYEIDFKSFGTVDTYGARNTKRFKLYASNSAGTTSAIFHGHVVVEGSLAGEDFTTATVAIHKEVTNIVGSSYVAGDLTISTPDATTLRFTVSRSSRYLNVLLYD